jgi:choline dehydrogenase-like flavoprotein
LSEYDLIVIGSGFGGAMAAAPAVLAGKRVLLIESGDWVARGPVNWTAEGMSEKTPYYDRRDAFTVAAGGYRGSVGTYACVGGASVFYGGVAMRMRAQDFEPDPIIDQDSGAAWPYRYADLEPFYTQAEQWLNVAGEAGVDPTEPPRSAPYPRAPGPLAPISTRIASAARSLGLHPFRLPLAINYLADEGRTPCPACGTCDGFACAVHAKNDVSVVLLPRLIQSGLELVTNTTAVRLEHANGRISSVACVGRSSEDIVRYHGRTVTVAAGALSTPRLLLASGLDAVNPAGNAVGRYLMRHCNSVVMGLFPTRPARGEFHKQVGIHDYYFGHPSVSAPTGRLGCLQQFATPLPDIVRANLPFGFGHVVAPIVSRTTGFIVMAEDRPRADNRVTVDRASASASRPAPATVTHVYDSRDLAARNALIAAARKILRRTGAIITYAHPIKTFSHALGTVRLGTDPTTAPLDEWGGFRGVSNLFVTDASALPRSAGVNPSLTIAANALRTGRHIADTL